MPLLVNLLIYIVTGCAAGYLAGLLGVGGGIIIVPVLTFLFEGMGFPQEVRMQLTIGTSMATVAVTAVFSARTHQKNGNVEWPRFRLLFPTVLVGSITGAFVGALVSRQVLLASVVAFELSVAGLFLVDALGKKARPEAERTRAPLPAASLLGISSLLAAVSSVVGIAGGTLFVPFLNFCGMGMRRAIGTAAALGVPIGFVAACVYLTTGLTAGKALPAYSAGYIYLPAFAGCVAGSIWTTKHGADLAKKMDVRWLKLAFSMVLLAASFKIVWGLL